MKENTLIADIVQVIHFYYFGVKQKRCLGQTEFHPGKQWWIIKGPFGCFLQNKC